MSKNKKALFVVVLAIPLLIVLFLLGRKQLLNPTLILGGALAISLITSSIMIIKAHKNPIFLEKKFYTNSVGAAIDLALYSFVMLCIWMFFESKNAIFQSILVAYPFIKGLDTFLKNKFKNFMQVFVYYRKSEEEKQKELEEKSKRKAKVKNKMQQKKPS